MHNDGSSKTVSKPVIGSDTRGADTFKIFGFHTTHGSTRCEKGKGIISFAIQDRIEVAIERRVVLKNHHLFDTRPIVFSNIPNWLPSLSEIQTKKSVFVCESRVCLNT